LITYSFNVNVKADIKGQMHHKLNTEWLLELNLIYKYSLKAEHFIND
jgi:hypothetical protein